MNTQSIDELTRDLSSPERSAFLGLESELVNIDGELVNRQDQAFTNLERKLMGRIESVEQIMKMNMINNNSNNDDEYDLVKPFELNISAETRPQMSAAGLSEHNRHGSHLSNHELHQIKSIHEKDHRKEPHSIMDESMGEVLDKTINFLLHSQDGYTKKIYEAELMEDIHGGDVGYYDRFKIHLIAMVLFIRDDRNIIYIGFLMVFISIIIYFINIITTRDA